MRNEFGRSMVEMLGVLAIIGVLSIAGVQGFKMAMTRHKVNEILNICRVILQAEGARSNTDTTQWTLSKVWNGKLPEDGCWISSYAGNSNNLYIGGCSDDVMQGIGNALGSTRWKQQIANNIPAPCGEMMMVGQPGGPNGLAGRSCAAYAAGTKTGYSVYRNN